MDQESFEEGLRLGIRSGLIVVRENERGQQPATKALEAYLDEVNEMIERRRNHGVVRNRAAERGDIFTQPVAHPADFGLPVSMSAEVAATASRIAVAEDARESRRLCAERARGEAAEAGVRLHPKLAAQADKADAP